MKRKWVYALLGGLAFWIPGIIMNEGGHSGARSIFVAKNQVGVKLFGIAH